MSEILNTLKSISLELFVCHKTPPKLYGTTIDDSDLNKDNTTKYELNPILFSKGIGFESKAVFNPTTILVNGTIYMFYRAENWGMENWGSCWKRPIFWNEDLEWAGISTIGLATSKDGYNFKRSELNPIIYPTLPDLENIGGCEDPRVSRVENTFFLTYTCVGGIARYSKLCLATSNDLIHWKKHGTVFGELFIKSAGILNEKINGKFIMYFGDKNIGVATSTEGLKWNIVEENLLTPREGLFDERLCEVGASPIIVDEGILLVYNGATHGAATRIGHYYWPNERKYRSYATGYAIFSKNDPSKLLYRSEYPFLNVTESFEKKGQVDNVLFTEGLIRKDNKWLLYYGCADTYIGVAVSN